MISLRKTLELKPDFAAAKHMVVALDRDSASKMDTTDREYVRELFDQYADTYDAHMKKKEVVYSSYIWLIIMNIIAILPTKIFKRINL